MDNPIDLVFDHLRAIADRAFELIHDIDARRSLIEQYFCVHPSTMEIHGQWYPVKTGDIPMEWVVADGADLIPITKYQMAPQLLVLTNNKFRINE